MIVKFNKETIMIDSKTTYSINDEFGEKTTITLEKLVADVLQKFLPDVHAWVQCTYNKIAQVYPEITRRKKGDFVRILSAREASKSPHFRVMINKIFGF